MTNDYHSQMSPLPVDEFIAIRPWELLVLVSLLSLAEASAGKLTIFCAYKGQTTFNVVRCEQGAAWLAEVR